MISKTIIPLLILSLSSCEVENSKALNNEITLDNTFVKLGIDDYQISDEWRAALTSRESQNYLDSLAALKRPLTESEKGWLQLIESRAYGWSSIKDSVRVPFGDTNIADTTYVLLGYRGSDDGFTYQYQTVCFDLTALANAYGEASDSINTNRMDRLFAHEYTHLLHKEWARQNDLVLTSFKDSILWECLYEGIGMYRSMSGKWFPNDNELSPIAKQTFATLYPIFVDRLIAIDSIDNPSEEQKRALHAKLSKAGMKQKWGALPVAVWLAMEANGSDKKLVEWIEKGPDAIAPLAKKYLPNEYQSRFEKTY